MKPSLHTVSLKSRPERVKPTKVDRLQALLESGAYKRSEALDLYIDAIATTSSARVDMLVGGVDAVARAIRNLDTDPEALKSWALTSADVVMGDIAAALQKSGVDPKSRPDEVSRMRFAATLWAQMIGAGYDDEALDALSSIERYRLFATHGTRLHAKSPGAFETFMSDMAGDDTDRALRDRYVTKRAPKPDAAVRSILNALCALPDDVFVVNLSTFARTIDALYERLVDRAKASEHKTA